MSNRWSRLGSLTRVGETSVRRIWRESRLFRFLVIWSFCAGALGPMLYFQFSYAVDLSTRGVDGEQRMLELYAQFRGWLNFAILIVQLAISGKLYRRFGLPMSSSAWPITYLFGFLWMGIALNLPIAMATIAAVRLEGDAVAKPALKILHNLLPERFRSQATGVTEGPVKRARWRLRQCGRTRCDCARGTRERERAGAAVGHPLDDCCHRIMASLPPAVAPGIIGAQPAIGQRRPEATARPNDGSRPRSEPPGSRSRRRSRRRGADQ